MMVAIIAAEAGQEVVLLEKGEKLGRKILISGNGRCNISNLQADDVHHYHGANPSFLRCVLGAFPLGKTLAFFADLGLVLHEEKRGRLFPRSNQAQSVVDLLEDRMRLLGVDIVLGAQVDLLEPLAEGYSVRWPGAKKCRAGRVVLASGGVSLPKLGADRSGMDMAVVCGHETTDLLPGLVALESDERYLAHLQGVKVWAEVEALLPSGKNAIDTDDLLFTQYGVSGFTILNLSARIVPHLAKGPLAIKVNLFPQTSAEQVSQMLRERWQRNPHRSLQLSFAGLLNGKLVRHFLRHFAFKADQCVEQISKTERWRLAQMLTDWRIWVARPRAFEYAEVTIGGLRTDAINPETLESYIAPGLYFAGEMLEVHGDLGGFNFQWAWSSGYLAGKRLGS